MHLGVFALLALFVSGSLAEDVQCSAGKQTADIVLNTGDVFKFDTAGKKYKKNMNCTANYKLGSCPSAVVTCARVNTVGNKKCSKGDRLLITDDTKTYRFCRKKKPTDLALTGDFKMQFLSDRKKQRYGIRCEVSCSDDGSGSGGNTVPPSGDCKCGLAKRTTKIVGGITAEVSEYPWQVGLVAVGGNKVYCGGALISDQWVLTAAHCMGSNSFQILLGEHDYTTTSETNRIRSDVASVVNHPSYNSNNYNFDFSLVKLSSPIDFSQNSHIRPICLPDDDSKTYAGVDAIVTGWGAIASGGSVSSLLREVTVQVMSNAACKNTAYASSQIKNQMLCAGVNGGGKDSCQGDSGGPLVTSENGDGVTPGQNYEHIGVVSWGAGCALSNYPGVYARTTKQLDWIKSTTGTLNTCPRQ